MSTARGDRRAKLDDSRSLLYKIPLNELFELPGRPHVVFQMRSYYNPTAPEDAVAAARNDVPFLFKAFETGQIGPKRMAKMHGGKARVATIHEYLDWTVTAQGANEDDELDFGGFRVLVIMPRFLPQYAPPDYLGLEEGKRSEVGAQLGAPLAPLPLLQTHSKPVCAATIRSGPGYLEIPFVATHEGKRGRGYCRCIVEAIEAMCRVLDVRKLMLCSTDDVAVKSTWQHLGFSFTQDDQMEEWDIPHSDLVYLQNTVQMHKDLPENAPRPPWKPLVVKHGGLRIRVYARIGEGRPLLLQRDPPSKRGRAPHKPGASYGAGQMLPAYSTATSFGTANGPAASEASGGLGASKCVSPMTMQWGDEPSSSLQVGPSGALADQEAEGRRALPLKDDPMVE